MSSASSADPTANAAPATPIALAPFHLARNLMRTRATWVLIDQGIVSAGNFLAARQLASYLPQESFGAYNVLLETMLYLNSLQAALVINPLTIKGATLGRDELGRLATGAFLLTLGLLPILGGATIFSVGALSTGQVAVAAVIALLLWQLQETLRRALIADLRYIDCIWGDSIRYVGQVVGITLLGLAGKLTLDHAFLVMALTAALAIVVQAAQVGMRPIRFWQLRLIARDFWRMGRWFVLGNAGGLVGSVGYWWTLTWAHGKEAAAVYGAIILPFKLANPIMNSICGLVMPAVARTTAAEGKRASTRQAIRYIAFGAALLLPYFLALAVLPTFMLKVFLPDDSPYIAYGKYLQLFVANYVVAYLSNTIGAWLAGLGRARWNFYSTAIAVVAAAVVGLPATVIWGVPGLILGGLFSSLVALVSGIWFVDKASALPATEPPAPIAPDEYTSATR
ncbi:lipopolysaccharide biosynthesis protein [Fontivita pretiosa]|jgi:O-antigen/teichoic acid export membrane protein|uniref:lipopolysaccharide biosynthesis protein n=1 Tax=Fontivita pretiosa TaxID=2989684 RepID=UPI003D1735B2